MRLKQLQIACDFETGKDIDNNKVWVYLAGTAVVQQKSEDKLYIAKKLNELEYVKDSSGTCSVIVDRSIDSWFNTITLLCRQNDCGADVWFHNLSYDGDYILCYLKQREIEVRNVIYGPQLMYFKCTVRYKSKSYEVSFRDTYQLMRRQLETIGKALNFEKQFQKYNQYPENCYSIPEREIQYMVRDVSILSRMVATIQINRIDSLTAAVYGLNEIKRSMAKNEAFDNYKAAVEIANNMLITCAKETPEKFRECLSEYIQLMDQANKVALGEKKLTKSGEYIIPDRNSGSYVFNSYFKQLSYSDDQYIRKAYKGGFCKINNIHQGKDIVERKEPIGPKTTAYLKSIGYTDDEINNAVEAQLDFNSMYLKILRDYNMPCGNPEYFMDELPDDLKMGIIHVRWKGYQVQKFGPILHDLPHDKAMLEDNSLNGYHDLYLTYPEFYVLMMDQELGQILEAPEKMEWLNKFKGAYHTIAWEIIDGFKFDICSGLFDKFVDKWYKIKSGNDPMMKIVAKQVLVNAVGSIGKRPKVTKKTPVYENGMIKTVPEDEIQDQNYVALPAYVNSIGRCLITLAANMMEDKFIYSDTDSIKVILGGELPFFDDKLPFKLSQTELGCFKVERLSYKAKFLKLKTYIEVQNKEGEHVTAAGIPSADSKFSWDGTDGKAKFSIGAEYTTFVPKHAIGGMMLVEQTRRISCAETIEQKAML